MFVKYDGLINPNGKHGSKKSANPYELLQFKCLKKIWAVTFITCDTLILIQKWILVGGKANKGFANGITCNLFILFF